MGFFSEELKIMDENTVKYMIEEMQSEINSLKSEKEEQAKEYHKEIDSLKNEKEEQAVKIAFLMKELEKYQSTEK